MDLCCGGCARKEPVEDGILFGKVYPIHKNFRKPISVIFQELLMTGKIDGKKNAVEFAESVLTFHELDQFSDALAMNLRDRIGWEYRVTNPDKDILIATCLSSSVRSVCIIMAILKTGAGYLPLDPQYPEQLLMDLIQAFGPILIIADENGCIVNKYDAEEFSDLCKIVTLEELWFDMHLPAVIKKKKKHVFVELFNLSRNSEESHELRPAVVFHTLGLHGNPVGVRLSHLSIINRILFDWRQLKLKSSASCCLTVPVSSPDSVPQMFVPLLKGCTLHVFRRINLLNMSAFVQATIDKSITRISIPYYFFYEFVFTISKGGPAMASALKHVKKVINRGGFLRFNEVNLFFQVFKNVTLVNCSGPAETTGEIVYEKFANLHDYQIRRILGRPSLGKTIDNTRLYITGTDLGIISDGNQGEICVSGLCLALGYVTLPSLKDEDLKRFTMNPHRHTGKEHEILFRTGEYGRIIVGRTDTREIYIEGREDNIMKRNGHKCSIDDVRMFLLELPFAKDAIVHALHKNKINEEMIAFIVVADEFKKMPDLVQIDYTLRSQLPEWAVPDDIMLIKEAEFPKHYLNTLCIACLVQKFIFQREPEFNDWNELGLPPKQLSVTIDLVKAVYKYSSIPVHITITQLNSSFFEIGVTSLTAVHILIYLNKLGYSVSLKDFFTTSSLTEFANLMEVKFKPIIPDAQFQLKSNFPIFLEFTDSFTMDFLKKKQKMDAIELIAKAYAERGELQTYNMGSIDDFEIFLEEVWHIYESQSCSIAITRNSDSHLVAVALCQDFFTIIDSNKANGSLFHILEFYHEIKGNMLPFIPHRTAETLEICWMATDHSLGCADNIQLITQMHTNLIRLAKEFNFNFVFNPTTNKLSRILCLEVFGYSLIEDFQANKYKDIDGSRPFRLAGDAVVLAGLLIRVGSPEPPSEVPSFKILDAMQYLNKLSKKGVQNMNSFADLSQAEKREEQFQTLSTMPNNSSRVNRQSSNF